jgi:hypothetical protein
VNDNTLTNNTVNNTTVNNVAPAPVVLPALAAAPSVLDVCLNLPGVQPGVPAGFVLTFARNGGLVCVTPDTARRLHPTAVTYRVATGSRLVFAKRGGLLCVGHAKKSAKPLIVAATTRVGKVLGLASKGKLVCLHP